MDRHGESPCEAALHLGCACGFGVISGAVSQALQFFTQGSLLGFGGWAPVPARWLPATRRRLAATKGLRGLMVLSCIFIGVLLVG